MAEERRELRGYYSESSPAKRRRILDAALESQADPQADGIRLQIWEQRYAQPGERGRDTRADGFLKLWIDLHCISENPPGRFGVKRVQRRLQRDLEALGFFHFYGESAQARELLYQECLHTARLYVNLCFSDRNYTSMVLGMMPMKRGRVMDKVSRDLRGLYEDLPRAIEIPEPVELLLRAARTADEELSKRSVQEETDERI